MTDMGPDDGGETVFPKAWPPDVHEEDRLDPKIVSAKQITMTNTEFSTRSCV